MEFYAKSKNRILTSKELEKGNDAFSRLKQLEHWTEEELKVIEQAWKKIETNKVEEQKTLKDHLKETEDCAKKFFEIYDEKFFLKTEQELIRYACRMHDIGKANDVFQARIGNNGITDDKLKGKEQIPHGYLSACSISQDSFYNEIYNSDDQCALLTAIYHHHEREDSFNGDEIKEYSRNYYETNIKEFLGDENWELDTGILSELLFRGKGEYQHSLSFTIADEPVWQKYALYKGMLNKFDWAASSGCLDVEIFIDKTKKELKTNIENKLHFGLHPVQTFMKDNSNKNVVIIAPTGSGKTEASLLWLDGEKGFYTLPLKVSSNAIYHRIKNNYNYHHVALLHSESLMEYLKEGVSTEIDGFGQYEKARGLSYPVTICTIDQLFKFVYKAPGTEIFAATLKYSKVIIDEIQSYSPNLIATLIYGLKIISDMGGKYAIVTATFPPVLKMFMEKYGLHRGQNGYVLKDFAKDSDLVRHKFMIRKSDFDIDEILEQGKEKKVLVLCNTVSKAQIVYRNLIDRNDETLEEVPIYLLHSRFIKKHRQQLEKKIEEFSNDDTQTGIWVCTQIVEASLDIDFHILHTELCTSDSLLQRMGRCNRKGRWSIDSPNIFIYASDELITKRGIYDKDILLRSLEYLSFYEGDIFTEEDKGSYMEQVYCPEAIKRTTYYKKIEKYLNHFSMVTPSDYDKKEVDKEFRMINSIVVIPDAIYNEHSELILQGLDVMQTSKVGREVKALIQTKLMDLTISLNIYQGRYPKGVDKDIIRSSGDDDGNGYWKAKEMPMSIHRSQLKYEFNEEMGRGLGLLLDEIEEEDSFL